MLSASARRQFVIERAFPRREEVVVLDILERTERSLHALQPRQESAGMAVSDG